MGEINMDFVRQRARELLGNVEVAKKIGYKTFLNIKSAKDSQTAKNHLKDYIENRFQIARTCGEFLAYSQILLTNYTKESNEYILISQERKNMEEELRMFEKGLARIISEEI